MEGPVSFWGPKEQESNLILQGHDDDDEQTLEVWNISNYLFSKIYFYFQLKKLVIKTCRLFNIESNPDIKSLFFRRNLGRYMKDGVGRVAQSV